jgi:hypothetical protein
MERVVEWFAGQSEPQRRFMETAFKNVPNLEKEVRAIYDGVQLSKHYDQLRLEYSLGLEFLKAKCSLDREVLKSWGERWNLTDDWCGDWVATTKIGQWYKVDNVNRDGMAPLTIGEVHTLKVPTEPLVCFWLPAWDPTEKTEDAYKDEALKIFGKQFELYRIGTRRKIEGIQSWDAVTGQSLPYYVRTPEIRQEAYFRLLGSLSSLRCQL